MAKRPYYGESDMKRSVSFLLATFFCFAAPVWVFSQSAPTRDGEAGTPLSLAKLVEEATERNPEILGGASGGGRQTRTDSAGRRLGGPHSFNQLWRQRVSAHSP